MSPPRKRPLLRRPDVLREYGLDVARVSMFRTFWLFNRYPIRFAKDVFDSKFDGKMKPASFMLAGVGWAALLAIVSPALSGSESDPKSILDKLPDHLAIAVVFFPM